MATNASLRASPSLRAGGLVSRLLGGLGYWCGRGAALCAAFGALRGAWLLALERRAGRTTRLVTLPGGHALLCRLGRSESDLRTLLQVWCKRCYDFEEVRDPRWIIDAGANVGYATRWFAVTYPEATVVAIEPDRENVELLRRNTAGLSNVVILEAALSAAEGQRQLVDPGAGPWSYRVRSATEDWAQGQPRGVVAGVSMASLIDRLGIDRVGLLKIDIEGGELEVFAECGAWIDRVDAIAAELHDRFRTGCTRAFVGATTGFGAGRTRGDTVFVARGT